MFGIDIATITAGVLANPLFTIVIIIGCLIGLFLLAALVSLGFYIFHSFKKNEDMKKKCMKIFKPALIAWVLSIVANIVMVVILVVQTAMAILKTL